MVILGTALGYVAWVSAQVFGIQQSEGLTTTQALAQLGMDKSLWLIQRSLLSVVLVALSGWTRYHPPAQASLEDEKAALARELELAPLRHAARKQNALGAVNLAPQALHAARGQEPDNPPTPAKQAFEPASEWPALPFASKRPKPGRNRRSDILRLTPPDTAEERIRAVLTQEPNISIRQLAKRAHTSESTASKWSRVLRSERLVE